MEKLKETKNSNGQLLEIVRIESSSVEIAHQFELIEDERALIAKLFYISFWTQGNIFQNSKKKLKTKNRKQLMIKADT